MIVPQFWAEGRAQHREPGRQITARRFGWSDTSQEEAHANADARAAEALRRLLSGEKLPRRDVKVPYNGGDSLPIREEIVNRFGETVITRNSYGARCLNTPNVLFADVDFSAGSPISFIIMIVGMLGPLAIAAGWATHSVLIGVGVFVLSTLFCSPFIYKCDGTMQRYKDDPLDEARDRIRKFLEQHPDWNLRLYRTPAGLRVLAMHKTFEPLDPLVSEFFAAIKVDPVYRVMCLNQKCFRARLTAKPRRIGIGDHLRPRPGVWPVADEYLPARQAWVARYESTAASYSACEFLESLGSGSINRDAQFVQELHDRECRATARLPLA